jgi:hypothetical protein
MEFHGSADAHVDADPRDVFARLIDLDRLPEWNDAIEAVLETPAALVEDSEWMIRMHAMGTRWDSRSHVLELDRDELRFVHRSMSDDGNPSYIIWSWTVTPEGAGARVNVQWAGHPKTFWRRVLLARIRSRVLRREVWSSMLHLEMMLRSGATATR